MPDDEKKPYLSNLTGGPERPGKEDTAVIVALKIRNFAWERKGFLGPEKGMLANKL